MSAFVPALPTAEEPSALLRLTRVVRERWWIIAAAAIICCGGALAVSLSSTKKYAATSKLLLRNSTLGTAVAGTELNPTSIDPTRDSTTNILLVTSKEVGNRVKRSLGLTIPVDNLISKLKVESEQNADLVDVTATDPDPRRAARIATAFAVQYVNFRKTADRQKVLEGENLLKQRLDSLPVDATAERNQLEQALQKLTALEAVQTGDAEVVDRASIPGSPSSPKPKRDALLALILGLGLGVALAFVLDFLDRRVKTVEDFERLYGYRPLVSIPQQSFSQVSPETRSAAFEPYRILRSSLAFATFEKNVQVLLVTSAILGEGKTSVAVNLARAVALSGQRVVLVEADLRRPSFQNHLELESANGLTTALVGGRSARELLQFRTLGLQNLAVLPSGPLPPNSAEILRSSAMGEILRELAGEGALVIIDAPPLLPVADAQILLDRPEIDACLVVARAYYTKRENVRRARAVLDQHRAQPLGLAITGLRERHLYEYYGSPDGHGAPEVKTSRRERRRERERDRERQAAS